MFDFWVLITLTAGILHSQSNYTLIILCEGLILHELLFWEPESSECIHFETVESITDLDLQIHLAALVTQCSHVEMINMMTPPPPSNHTAVHAWVRIDRAVLHVWLTHLARSTHGLCLVPSSLSFHPCPEHNAPPPRPTFPRCEIYGSKLKSALGWQQNVVFVKLAPTVWVII